MGTLRKRQKNKDGTTSYYLEVMVDHKRYSKTVRCKSEAQAKKELNRFAVEVEDNRINFGNMSWPELCELWLEEYAKKQYKKTSYTNALSHYNIHLKKAFNKQVKKITRTDIQRFINSLEVSPKTVRNIFATMNRTFVWAVQKELVRDNPCQYIDLPKKEKKTAAYLDKETFEKTLRLLRDEPIKYRAGIYLALFGGLRRGEIFGLDWDDIDLDAGTFEVKRERIYRKGGGTYVDTPKSESGYRRGALPDEIVLDLKKLHLKQMEWKLMHGTLWNETGSVMIHEDGHRMAPSTLAHWLDKFIKKNNLPHFTLHSLRHTHATIMKSMGADIEEIQRKLGHSDKSTTENIYVHLFEKYEDLDKKTQRKINDLIKSV